jgi:hypothetical protein
MVVELDLHPHGPERLDEVGLLGKEKPRTARLEDHLGIRIEHLIAQTSFKHSDDAPHAGLGAVLPAQLLRFRDPNDVTSMELLEVRDVPTAYGEGYAVTSMTAEPTSRP